MAEPGIETASERTVPKRRYAGIVAVLSAIVCFVNVLPNDYCFDDDLIVRHSARVNQPGQWGAIWTTDHWWEAREATPNRDLLYRPVALSSYRLMRTLAGPSPLPQHLFNILLHATVCFFVVRLCRHCGATETSALTAGVIFAVLPIHCEVIASVVGRADLLATLGVLVALEAHLKSMTCTTGLRMTAWRSWASVAAFVAMGAKESGMVVVPLVVLFDLLWSARGRSGARPGRWRRWMTIVRVSPLAVPTAGYLLLRFCALGGRLYQQAPLTKTVNVLVDAPPWQHLLGVVQLFGMYWAKTIWPAVLSIKYSINSIRLATGPLDVHVLIGWTALAGLIVLAVVTWRRGQKSIAGLSAALAISYLPTSNAFVLMQVFFAERIWYLPSVFLAVLVGMIPARVMRRPAVWTVLAVVVSGMTVRCWIRNADWRDNGTLFASALSDQPEGVGPLELYGRWLVDRGDPQRGIEFLSRAVTIDPGFIDAHRSLGRAHARIGNMRAALHHLQLAEMQAPGHTVTRTMLEDVSRELANADEELKRIRATATERPGDLGTELVLVRRLRELGLVREALGRLELGEADFASDADWQAEYAVALVLVNDPSEALRRYRASLRLSPDHPQRAVELAMLLLERRDNNDLEEAWRWASHASRLAPDAPAVLACRAELTALRGDLAAAHRLYGRAIAALPSDSKQRHVFRQRLKALGGTP